MEDEKCLLNTYSNDFYLKETRKENFCFFQSNLNELIVKFGGDGTTTLKQSVVTRWLSLFTCIESVYLNYDAVLLALENRRSTKYLNDLTKYNLLDVLLLLAPLNAALQAIQIDEAPSLHLVIPFHQKLSSDYSTHSKLLSTARKKYPTVFQSSFAYEYLSNESNGMYFEWHYVFLHRIFCMSLHFKSKLLLLHRTFLILSLNPRVNDP